MVKRLYLLVVLSFTVVYILGFSQVYAGDRWVLVKETETAYWYYDAYSLRQYGKPSDRFINVWIMQTSKEEGNEQRRIAHEFIRENNGAYLEDEVKVYNNNGQLQSSYSNRDKGWRNPAPNSDWGIVIWAVINRI